MFSPSKPMRPRRPRPQDSSTGISCANSHDSSTTQKDFVGFRYLRHVSKQMGQVVTTGRKSQQSSRMARDINEHFPTTYPVCVSNESIACGSAIAGTSNNCILQGHFCNNRKPILAIRNHSPHKVVVENSKNTRVDNYINDDDQSRLCNGITASNLNRYYSRFDKPSQRSSPQVQTDPFILPLTKQSRSLHQDTKHLSRHISPALCTQRQHVGFTPAVRISISEKSSDSCNLDLHSHHRSSVLARLTKNFRFMAKSTHAESSEKVNIRKLDVQHLVNLQNGKAPQSNLSNVNELSYTQENACESVFPITLHTYTNMQNPNNPCPSQAIDNKPARGKTDERAHKSACLSLEQWPSPGDLSAKRFADMHGRHFFLHPSHSSFVRFDTNFVLVLKIIKIRSLRTRPRVQMASLSVRFIRPEVNRQRSDHRSDELDTKQSTDTFENNFPLELYVASPSDAYNSTEQHTIKTFSTKEYTALSHMSVGPRYKHLSPMPLLSSLSPVTLSERHLSRFSHSSTMHRVNDISCTPQKTSAPIKTTRKALNYSPDDPTICKHSFQSNADILKITIQVIRDMLGTQNITGTSTILSVGVKPTSNVVVDRISSNEASPELSPHLPTSDTQKDEASLSFIHNGNTVSSKKSLGTGDGLTRPTATPPEESTEMELYARESIFNGEFSCFTTTTGINPNCFPMILNNAFLLSSEGNNCKPTSFCRIRY